MGSIDELETMGQRLRDANALTEYVAQPMHLSVYGRDPDGLAIEVVWRVPNADWTYEELWREPLDLETAKPRWGATRVTGSAAGETA